MMVRPPIPTADRPPSSRGREIPTAVFKKLGEYACDDPVCLDPSANGAQRRKIFCGPRDDGDDAGERRCCKTPIAKMIKDSSSYCGNRNAAQDPQKSRPLLNHLVKLMALHISQLLPPSNEEVHINTTLLWKIVRHAWYNRISEIRVTHRDTFVVLVEVALPRNVMAMGPNPLEFKVLAVTVRPGRMRDTQRRLALVGSRVHQVFRKLNYYCHGCP